MTEWLNRLDATSLVALVVLCALGLTAELHGLDHESDLLVTAIVSGIVGFMARRPGQGTTTITAGDPPTVEQRS